MMEDEVRWGVVDRVTPTDAVDDVGCLIDWLLTGWLTSC